MIFKYFIRCISTKRPESRELRKYLIEKYKTNKIGYHCTMCLKPYPLSILDSAHLKPRYTLQSTSELKDVNNVEFMCKMCHNLYDNGHISVDYYKNIIIHNDITKYRHLMIINNLGKTYSQYSIYNSNYLIWHYQNIFRK